MEVNTGCLEMEDGRTSASPELLWAHQVGSREQIITQGPALQTLFSVYSQLCCCHSSLWSYAETGKGHSRCWSSWCIHSADPTCSGSLNEARVRTWLCTKNIIKYLLSKFPCGIMAGVFTSHNKSTAVREINLPHFIDDVTEGNRKKKNFTPFSEASIASQIYVLIKTVQPHKIRSQWFFERMHNRNQNSSRLCLHV